ACRSLGGLLRKMVLECIRIAQVAACRAIFAIIFRAGGRTLAPTSKARNLQRSSPTRGTVADGSSSRTAPGSARPTRQATGNGVTLAGSGAMKNPLGKPSGFPFFMVLRRIGGKSGLTGREAGKLVVAKPTIHLSLLSPCILLILPLSGQAMTP